MSSALSPGLLPMQRFFSWPWKRRLSLGGGGTPFLWLASDPVITRRGRQTALIRFLPRKISYQCKWGGRWVHPGSWRCFLTKRFFCTLERKPGWAFFFVCLFCLVFFGRKHWLKKKKRNKRKTWHDSTFFTLYVIFVKTAAKPAGEYLGFGIVGFLATSLRKLDYTQKKYFDKRRTRDKTI